MTGMPAATMSPDGLQSFTAAFQLDGVHAGLLQEATGIAQGILGRGLVGHERHIAHQQSVSRTARHSFAVMQHILHGNG